MVILWMGECAKEEIEGKAFNSLAAGWTLVEAAVIVDAKASRLTRTRSGRITLGCKRCQKCATSNQESSHTTSCTMHMALTKKLRSNKILLEKSHREQNLLSLEYIVWHL